MANAPSNVSVFDHKQQCVTWAFVTDQRSRRWRETIIHTEWFSRIRSVFVLNSWLIILLYEKKNLFNFLVRLHWHQIIWLRLSPCKNICDTSRRWTPHHVYMALPECPWTASKQDKQQQNTLKQMLRCSLCTLEPTLTTARDGGNGGGGGGVAGLTFGLFGWLRLGLWAGARSAAPNMLLLCPPGGLVFCGWATVSGPPKIPLVFPPARKHDPNMTRVTEWQFYYQSLSDFIWSDPFDHPHNSRLS